MAYERTSELKQALLHFASAMSAGSEDARAYAESQGWLGDAGELTLDGKEVAQAFVDQQQCRSVFRVG